MTAVHDALVIMTVARLEVTYQCTWMSVTIPVLRYRAGMSPFLPNIQVGLAVLASNHVQLPGGHFSVH